ncbi:MAG: ATP-dependent RNA helicase HrpA [Mariprofundaceae bacterium]|nr:ATP-dependent RNA helicase HrpA [Mariprofundaceae bacterium]
MSQHVHWSALKQQITSCMLLQQRSLSNRLRQLRSRERRQQDIEQAYLKLEHDIAQAQQQCALRKTHLPQLTYPEDLPISQSRESIQHAIEQNQVVIIAGETGSGKTTQLPKICLALGRGITGKIGHTQPRRIAARSVATRIAHELNTPLGKDVGYKIRFSDHSQANTYIKLMTDGILLAEIQHDPQLLQYDTIIMDEAHERSLNIDFLMGYLKNILPKRPDLKIIITSATINTQRFSQFFHDAPVIEVSGRSYPVDICYRPLLADEADDKTLQNAIQMAVDEAASLDVLGDILVFLPGEREIRDTAHALEKYNMRDTTILPLFSRLSPAEQDKVFKGHKGRRIVLATNVAETSLTVPGIRFVIDVGTARISRYSPKSKVQQLPIEPISQASANQRAGRCGRVAAGVCFRLYSEDDFERRPEHTDPEIRRTNLAHVILQMISLGLGDIHDFDFMEPPEKRSIQDGYRLLEELQSIDASGKLTDIGKKLIRLPVDPRLGRMLVQAHQQRALHEVLIIVAGLSVQDPRVRPADQAQKADEKHHVFTDKSSDFLSWLKLWAWYQAQEKQLSKSKLRKLCANHFVVYLRMREWHDLHGQLLGIVREMNMIPNQEAAEADDVHKSILAGLLSHVCQKHEKKGLMGARGLQVAVFPGSPLSKKPPAWLMAGFLVETSRLFARCIAPIDPTWLERLAPHLLKHNYSEPHWSKKRAQVCAYETITLYGLPIISKRLTHFGNIEPDISRALFIRHALVYQEFHSFGLWLKHNRNLLQEIETLEAKSRRRDLLADEQIRFDFFDHILPAGIFSGKLFEKWRKKAEKEDKNILFLSKALLLDENHQDVDMLAFPNVLQVQGLSLKIQYHFDPSQQADGMTLDVPMLVLGQLDCDRFAWLVPGLLVEKVISLIKSLPKNLRTNFVPAPQFAQACVENITFAEGNLLLALSRHLQRMTGVYVASQDWNIAQLPPHLCMKFKVFDQDDKILGNGSDLKLLQQQYAHLARVSLQALQPENLQSQQGLTRWSFADLPEVVQQQKNGMSICLFPALVDEQDSVALQFFESEQSAQQAMFAGVRRLLILSLNQQVEMLRKKLPQQAEMVLLYASIGDSQALLHDIVQHTFDSVFMQGNLPRTKSDFTALLDAGRAEVVITGKKTAGMVVEILKAHASLQQKLTQVKAVALKPVLEDIQQQVSQLVYAGFIQQTPQAWLQHISRYVQAAEKRLQKAGQNLKQDQIHMQQIQTFWHLYQQRADEQLYQENNASITFRWHIEELRVSLFAQDLKTSVPISAKRLEKVWLKVMDDGVGAL